MDNNKYKFAVKLPSKEVDNYGIYKQTLVNIVLDKYPNLTMSGMDFPEVRKGVQYAGPGDFITFGANTDHDVSWVRNPNYNISRHSDKIYDLVTEWNGVINRLDAFAKEKKRSERSRNDISIRIVELEDPNVIYIGGRKVQIFDNFIKVGYTIIPRKLNRNLASCYTCNELSILEAIISFLR